MNADELEKRFVQFGVRIIRLSKALPGDDAGKHLSKQILRSGTAPAPNYGEARGGESRADFIHKLGIVLKELNETKIWLRMIKESEMAASEQLQLLYAETVELSKIVQSTLKSARSPKS